MSRAQAVWSTGSTNISALLSFSMLSTSWGGANYKYISKKGERTKLILLNVSEAMNAGLGWIKYPGL